MKHTEPEFINKMKWLYRHDWNYIISKDNGFTPNEDEVGVKIWEDLTYIFYPLH
jgi:hypothetical protein